MLSKTRLLTTTYHNKQQNCLKTYIIYLVIVIIHTHYLIVHRRTDARYTWIRWRVVNQLHTTSQFFNSRENHQSIAISSARLHMLWPCQQNLFTIMMPNSYTPEKWITTSVTSVNNRIKIKETDLHTMFFCLRFRQMGRVCVMQAVCYYGMEDCECHVWGAVAETNQHLHTIHTHKHWATDAMLSVTVTTQLNGHKSLIWNSGHTT